MALEEFEKEQQTDREKGYIRMRSIMDYGMGLLWMAMGVQIEHGVVVATVRGAASEAVEHFRRKGFFIQSAKSEKFRAVTIRKYHFLTKRKISNMVFSSPVAVVSDWEGKAGKWPFRRRS